MGTAKQNAKRLLISVIATAGSTAVMFAVPPWRETPFLVYFGAVVIVARYFGYTSAAWTAVLSAVAADYFLFHGRIGFEYRTDDLVRILGFFFVCAIIVGIARERRKVEKKLRQSLEETSVSLERLQRAQEVGRVASWELDPATGIVRWSANAQKVFVGSRLTESVSELLGRLHPDDVERVKAAMAEVAAVAQSLEYRVRDDEGGYRWYHTRTQPAGARVLGATVDVDERKQAERALLSTEKLAAAGRLSATIAHEINNPLEAVSNLLYLALQSELTGEARKYLAMAENEVERVSHIAKQTLGFYRSSTQARPVVVARAAEETAQLYLRRAESRGVQLRCDCATEAKVLAPEGEIKQVLSNLVSNAIDASRDGGHVIVRVRENGAKVVITVCDDGAGISAKVGERLFEPFFTTKKDVGTGLGLWVTKGLVENLGGSIRFRSRVGSGTVFRVALVRVEQQLATGDRTAVGLS